MQNKNLSIALIMLGVFGLSSTATAAFSIIQGGGSIPASSAAAPQPADTRKPLSSIIKAMVPEGWKGFAAPGANTDVLVDLIANDGLGEWDRQLQRLGERYNFGVNFSPALKRVVITAGPGGIKDLRPNVATTPVAGEDKPLVASGIFQVGQNQLSEARVSNRGAGVLFDDAVGQLVPNGLGIRISPTVNVRQTVNWRSGTTWLVALNDVVRQNNAQATINWTMQPPQVFIERADVKSAIRATTWTVRQTDGTLENTLNRWIKEAGWQKLWWDIPSAEDEYQIFGEGEFSGTFEEALVWLQNSVSKSAKPINIVPSSNRVVRVTTSGARK